MYVHIHCTCIVGIHVVYSVYSQYCQGCGFKFHLGADFFSVCLSHCCLPSLLRTWVWQWGQVEMRVPVSSISLLWGRYTARRRRRRKRRKAEGKRQEEKGLLAVCLRSHPLTHGSPSLVILISTIRSHISLTESVLSRRVSASLIWSSNTQSLHTYSTYTSVIICTTTPPWLIQVTMINYLIMVACLWG